MMKSSSSSSSHHPWAITALLSMAVTMVAGYALHQRRTRALVREWEAKRQEERTGRIRAEQKLRAALLLQPPRDAGSRKQDLTLHCLGTVVSPYPKRMGTPRQGALVPTSRGYIQFDQVSPEALDGIDSYSHVWILFGFHENTSLPTSRKTKIRPPRGGGIKVGQLATRSPHRPNPLGLSLVTLERWDPSTRRLHISALDLVQGTPVYDVKPYVHWDIPTAVSYNASTALRLPQWVRDDQDVLPRVDFAPSALASLQACWEDHRLAPLYDDDDDDDSRNNHKDPTSLACARQTLQEILSQDPRSSHKGLAVKNQRGSLSADSSYKLLFCQVQVEFVVDETGARVIGIHEIPAATSKEEEEEG